MALFQFQDNPLAFLVSTAVLLVMTSSMLALSLSLHSAYLWFTVVCITLIFLATFKCTYSVPAGFIARDHSPSSQPEATDNDFQDIQHVYWLEVDLPPPYEVVAGIHPPSYAAANSGLLKMPTDDNTTASTDVKPQPLDAVVSVNS